MFSPEILSRAEVLLAAARIRNWQITTAESCTGGLIAGLLTEIPGSSDVFERGFVTYSNNAKREMLGVAQDVLVTHGAVSREVSIAMARGALEHSQAKIAVAVTGIAGPTGGTAEKPVGLVHLAVIQEEGNVTHRECRFGNIGRHAIRLATVAVSLEMLQSLM